MPTGESDQQWLQDLENILQRILQLPLEPHSRILLAGQTSRREQPYQPLLSSERVGALKTVMVSLALWQRVLQGDIPPTISREGELPLEMVKPLEQ